MNQDEMSFKITERDEEDPKLDLTVKEYINKEIQRVFEDKFSKRNQDEEQGLEEDFAQSDIDPSPSTAGISANHPNTARNQTMNALTGGSSTSIGKGRLDLDFYTMMMVSKVFSLAFLFGILC